MNVLWDNSLSCKSISINPVACACGPTESGLFGFGPCFGSVTGRSRACSLAKTSPKTKNPRSASLHDFRQCSNMKHLTPIVIAVVALWTGAVEAQTTIFNQNFDGG